MRDRDAVYLALHDAIAWQRSLADAYVHIEDSPERAKAFALVKAYKQVLKRRYPQQSKGPDPLSGAKYVSIDELRRGIGDDDCTPTSEEAAEAGLKPMSGSTGR